MIFKEIISNQSKNASRTFLLALLYKQYQIALRPNEMNCNVENVDTSKMNIDTKITRETYSFYIKMFLYLIFDNSVTKKS